MKNKDIDKLHCCHKADLNLYFVLKSHVVASYFALLRADHNVDSHSTFTEAFFFMVWLIKCPLKFWKQLCHNKYFLNKQYNLYSQSKTKTLIKCTFVNQTISKVEIKLWIRSSYWGKQVCEVAYS